MRRAAGLTVGLVLIFSGSVGPVEATPAVPETVRVNIAGLGTAIASIDSTGGISAIRPDGTVAYEGRGPLIARRDVARSIGPATRSPRPAPEDREDRRAWAIAQSDEARAAGSGGPATVAFELAAPPAEPSAAERVIVTANAVVPLRFRAIDGLLMLDGRVFKGELELAQDVRGRMIVINQVATFDYLSSVVGAEMPSGWAPQALAAQAIAARTFLLRHLGRQRGYDLEGDQRAQEYSGVRSEAPSTVAAVVATRGVIATFAGRPIDALYSANAGGATEDSENVYPNAVSYLRGVPSPGDAIAASTSFGRNSWTWTRELTAAQLGERLAARGMDVGTPGRIELTEVSPTGRVIRARIVGESGTREAVKDEIRGIFGIRSTLFTVRKVAGGTLEIVESGDLERQRALAALGARLIGPLYRHTVSDGEPAEPSIAATLHRLPDRFVFSGRGFGHGVGMSQWGAQAMALEGAHAEAILKHYYRGIALTVTGGP